MTIEYLRVMKESDFKCLGSMEYDPLNPKLLMAVMMLNTGDSLREYTPLFVFKGQKKS
ncbi:MAG: hypothetical protein KKD44_25255 [Proteobacteria bacterium]|nr:hypothetical protein [Pseudomonadota bacterium]